MSIVDDTRKSLYAILASRLTSGNGSFQVQDSKGNCRDSRGRAGRVASGFQTWANAQAKNLSSVKGNIIPVDDSILAGFPPRRPSSCEPLDSIRIMLDKDGIQTSDPSKNVVRSSDGNVTHDWTRSYWFKEKKRDFGIYKAKIDKYIEELKKQVEFDRQQADIALAKQKEEEKIALFTSLIPIAGILLLYTSGAKS
jgi:hypothetical protein